MRCSNVLAKSKCHSFGGPERRNAGVISRLSRPHSLQMGMVSRKATVPGDTVTKQHVIADSKPVAQDRTSTFPRPIHWQCHGSGLFL